MGLNDKQETDEQIMNRLAANAGGMINMFMAAFQTPKGVDLTQVLIFTSSLAGYACHEAVKAENGKFVIVTANDNRNFYFGDDLNKYLLESSLSVVGLCRAVTDVSMEEVSAIVRNVAGSVGSEQFNVCRYKPSSLYEQVKDCWEGIFDNMIAKNCREASEWPVLFGIIVQNVLLKSIEAGAPKDEAGKIAIECAVAVSKMDKDSF